MLRLQQRDASKSMPSLEQPQVSRSTSSGIPANAMSSEEASEEAQCAESSTAFLPKIFMLLALASMVCITFVLRLDFSARRSRGTERALSNLWPGDSSIDVRGVRSDERTRKLHTRVLPRFNGEDQIELFHLRSYPLQQIVSSVGSFLVQTSGIALRSTIEKKLVVLEYRPANYTACFLPVIDLRPNNKSTLHWDKRSVLSYRTELDKKYWQQSTFLGHVNGVVYENYVKWVEEYISRDKIFVPQSICSSAEEISCFIRAETWETFLTDSLENFANLAVQMNAIIPPRAKEMHLLSNTEPVRFTLSDVRRESDYVYTPIGDGGISSSNSGSSDQLLPNYAGSAGASGGGSGRKDRYEEGSAPGGRRGRRALAAKFRALKRNSTANTKGGITKGSVAPAVTTATNSSGALASSSNSSMSTGNNSSSSSSSSGGGTDGASGGITNSSSMSSIITGSAKAEEMAAVTNMTESEMAEYYASLMVCMQEYTMEDFTSALGSCLTERIGYIHIDGSYYYRISPRFPFALMQEYLQPIPSAKRIEVESAGLSDFLISLALLAAAVLGLVASLWRLNLFDWIWAKVVRIKRRRVGAAPPAEGGYNKASELPVYKSWGIGGSEADLEFVSRTPGPMASYMYVGGRGSSRGSVAFFNPSPYAPASFISTASGGKKNGNNIDATNSSNDNEGRGHDAASTDRYFSIINMDNTG